VFSALAALLTLGVLVAYFQIMADQGDPPAGWFVGLLVVAMAGFAYGVTNGAGREVVLMVASCLVGALGLLAIFSVGLLLLASGALGFFASDPFRSPAPSA
jgi:hypothetical protein